MNVPFSQPNLSRYIQEGSDATVSKVTFPDGTSQTTAASAATPPFNNIQTSVNGGAYIYSVPSYNGSNEVQLTALSGLTITPTSSSQNVVLQISILGEWSANPHSCSISFQRVVGGVATWLDPRPTPNSKVPINAIFALGYNYNENTSTIETLATTFVDTPNTTQLVTYNVYLKNTAAASTYYLNRTKVDGTGGAYERGISTFTAECKG